MRQCYTQPMVLAGALSVWRERSFFAFRSFDLDFPRRARELVFFAMGSPSRSIA